MATEPATFAAALAQYYQAHAAQEAFYKTTNIPANEAFDAARAALGTIKIAGCTTPELEAAERTLEAAETAFDDLVSECCDAANIVMLTPAKSIAEIRSKLDVAVQQEMWLGTEKLPGYLSVLRADAHLLAGE